MENYIFDGFESFEKYFQKHSIEGKIIKIKKAIENNKNLFDFLKKIHFGAEKEYYITANDMEIVNKQGYCRLSFKNFEMIYDAKANKPLGIRNFNFGTSGMLTEYFLKTNARIFYEIRNIFQKEAKLADLAKLSFSELAAYISAIQDPIFDCSVKISAFSFETLMKISSELADRKSIEAEAENFNGEFLLNKKGWVFFSKENGLRGNLEVMSDIVKEYKESQFEFKGTVNWDIINSMSYFPLESKIIIRLPEYSEKDFKEIWKFKMKFPEMKIVII